MSARHSLSRAYPKGERRSAKAQQTLATAYQKLFTGHGGEQDAQLVLVDLANFTGFYRVNGPGFSGDDRAHSDGMRLAYGRIFQFLRMSDEERRQLEEAARLEAVTDADEAA